MTSSTWTASWEKSAWLITLITSAAIFGLLRTLASRALGAGSDLGPATAAFVTALALLPVHRTLAEFVGRAVDRDRFVAVAAVQQFAGDVRAGRRAPEEIETVLREAQGDPGLQVALSRPDGWTDLHGHPVLEPSGFDLEAGGDTMPASAWAGNQPARAGESQTLRARPGYPSR